MSADRTLDGGRRTLDSKALTDMPRGPRLIYELIRCIAWPATRIYFRKRMILGRENLRFRGPAIIVVNHPNTFMDVLNSAPEIPRILYFLGNWGLFKNPISNFLLRRLFTIPVKRREDVAEGETRNNDAAFEASFAHLARGGALFIAAEGVSWMNRFMRPLKTGAARIALGAEAQNGWELGVKIIPIGLSYDAPDKFRSRVVINVGEPVWAKNWAGQFDQDNVAAVENLTQHLENQLSNLTIDCRDEPGEQFVTRLETMLDNGPRAAILQNRGTARPLAQWFSEGQFFVKNLLGNVALRSQVAEYWQTLETAGANDLNVAIFSEKKSARRRLADTLLFFLGWPLMAAGLRIWAIPCALPWLAARQLKLYVGYASTVKLLVGILTWPFWFWLVFVMLNHWFSSAWLALAGLVGSLLLGLFLEKWVAMGLRLWAGRRARKLPGEVLEKLAAMRHEILSQIQTERPANS